MSVIGLVTGIGITFFIVIWVVYPFMFRTEEAVVADASVVERQRERLNVYYNRVLRNLHDIDEDYATGKLREDEYRTEREQWVQRGVQVLKALETLDTQHLVAPVAADDVTIDEAIDRVIEEQVTEEGRIPQNMDEAASV